jgi:hypothetical protein
MILFEASPESNENEIFIKDNSETLLSRKYSNKKSEEEPEKKNEKDESES